jgi:hypothetical protein
MGKERELALLSLAPIPHPPFTSFAFCLFPFSFTMAHFVLASRRPASAPLLLERSGFTPFVKRIESYG